MNLSDRELEERELDFRISRTHDEYLKTEKSWVGLTDEEIETIWHEDDNEDIPATLNEFICAARVIEAKLKAKNERLEKNT